ncbi:MAG: nucleotide exchange factor GrpE [Candidatus Magasanikbacteria bacterium]|jgi:molecular chaperone GrpE|nr:nucleotide exchange factor GrpE [Candidatus Magasanikbacteria bacterium]MBT4221098.1 nucleotide exchange factor GrpE [Candidatus Magasanikbacteria bacterium]MBT4350558.1 nucleotide exchange factor GrpE [Candidatus Magasanikbacteria bacterium]MBT4542143.1 nucleotide exchange factor GrpE [Candidatus Magasanikbacteria bacterium]MBT6253265.1 nucleotide exchange factor GrpE [Candidatus Magasanikbacteria bacterium]
MDNTQDHSKEEVIDKEEGETCEKCTTLEEYKIGWQRAQADYQNLQKETENRRTELVQMSELQILEEFIPVYDNFKKAAAHTPENEDKEWQNWAKGIDFIKQQFGTVLKSHNIEEIITVGEVFTTEKHEALGEEEHDEYDDGVIVKEVDAGYTMRGKVIKVAKVIINKKA